jgi:hypothetical protein
MQTPHDKSRCKPPPATVTARFNRRPGHRLSRQPTAILIVSSLQELRLCRSSLTYVERARSGEAWGIMRGVSLFHEGSLCKRNQAAEEQRIERLLECQAD